MPPILYFDSSQLKTSQLWTRSDYKGLNTPWMFVSWFGSTPCQIVCMAMMAKFEHAFPSNTDLWLLNRIKLCYISNNPTHISSTFNKSIEVIYHGFFFFGLQGWLGYSFETCTQATRLLVRLPFRLTAATPRKREPSRKIPLEVSVSSKHQILAAIEVTMVSCRGSLPPYGL